MTIANRVQVLEPISKRWVKLDTATGRIIALKRTPGQWANITQRFVSGLTKAALKGE